MHNCRYVRVCVCVRVYDVYLFVGGEGGTCVSVCVRLCVCVRVCV